MDRGPCLEDNLQWHRMLPAIRERGVGGAQAGDQAARCHSDCPGPSLCVAQ